MVGIKTADSNRILKGEIAKPITYRYMFKKIEIESSFSIEWEQPFFPLINFNEIKKLN